VPVSGQCRCPHDRRLLAEAGGLILLKNQLLRIGERPVTLRPATGTDHYRYGPLVSNQPRLIERASPFTQCSRAYFS
jgi:hypothetical protein